MNIKSILPYKNVAAAMIVVVVFIIVIRSIFSHYSLQNEGIAVRMRKSEERDLTIKKWEKLKSESSELEGVFLVGDTLVFKKFIEEKAKASKINIALLKTSNIEKDLYWEAKMLLDIACTYSNFVTFTAAIEKKSVVINRVMMSMGEGGGNIGVNLTLKGVILKK